MQLSYHQQGLLQQTPAMFENNQYTKQQAQSDIPLGVFSQLRCLAM
jgi:hypothetical protein